MLADQGPEIGVASHDWDSHVVGTMWPYTLGHHCDSIFESVEFLFATLVAPTSPHGEALEPPTLNGLRVASYGAKLRA